MDSSCVGPDACILRCPSLRVGAPQLKGGDARANNGASDKLDIAAGVYITVYIIDMDLLYMYSSHIVHIYIYTYIQYVCLVINMDF